jgi:hypothetical protein
MVFSLSIFSSCVSEQPLNEYPEELWISQYKRLQDIKKLPNSDPNKLGMLHQYIQAEKANVVREHASAQTSMLPLAQEYLKTLVKELDYLNEILTKEITVKPQPRTQSTSPTYQIFPGDNTLPDFITIDMDRDTATSPLSSGSMSPKN